MKPARASRSSRGEALKHRPRFDRLEDRLVPGETFGASVPFAPSFLAAGEVVRQDAARSEPAGDRLEASADAVAASWVLTDLSGVDVAVPDAAFSASSGTSADAPTSDVGPPSGSTVDLDLPDFGSAPRGGVLGGSAMPVARADAAFSASSGTSGVAPTSDVGPPSGSTVDLDVPDFGPAPRGGVLGGSAMPATARADAATAGGGTVSAPSTVAPAFAAGAAPDGATAAAAPPALAAVSEPAGGGAVPELAIGDIGTKNPVGYTPQQIRHAYGFDQLPNDGTGETIALVDAFDNPNALADLNYFSAQFGLPQLVNGQNFIKLTPQGQPKANANWITEESLDVQWAHAIAPNARIMLVEAVNSSFGNLLGAVDAAVKNGAQVVSMSWAEKELSTEATFDAHFNHAGVTFFAASGDSGSGVLYPAASPYVVATGGTQLPLDTNGNRTGPEVGWKGSGGGVSAYEAEPAYQVSYGIANTGGKRGNPDVAYNASQTTGYPIYDSTGILGLKGWFKVGGTSAASPQWAALVALADQGRATPLSSNDLTNMPVYDAAAASVYAANYTDITSGSNGGFSAGPGYDFVTGLGSPLANNIVPYLESL